MVENDETGDRLLVTSSERETYNNVVLYSIVGEGIVRIRVWHNYILWFIITSLNGYTILFLYEETIIIL